MCGTCETLKQKSKEDYLLDTENCAEGMDWKVVASGKHHIKDEFLREKLLFVSASCSV